VLVTLTTTHRPATDLGYLLHKHPGRAQVFPVSAGTAHVFLPGGHRRGMHRGADWSTSTRSPWCAATTHKSFALGQYVNDRPYAAGSMLAVAISTVFRSAMNGVSAKQDVAEEPIPLAIHIPALPARGGTDLVARLFTPLGWQVTANQLPLDQAFPDWGDSAYVDLRLTASTITLAAALKMSCCRCSTNAKHYWISADEIDKLLRAGDGWLGSHPERELISQRYLRRRPYINAALARLAEADDNGEDDLDTALAEPRVTETPDRPEPLAALRRTRSRRCSTSGAWGCTPCPCCTSAVRTRSCRCSTPRTCLAAMARERVTMQFLVPVMWAALLAVPGFDNYDLTALELAVTGGAPCPLPVLEYFQAKGMPFQDSFGMTEIAGGSILDADHVKEKAGSIGRPYFHLQGRIVDEKDRDVPTGEVGELVVRGPNVFAGFWGLPEGDGRSVSRRLVPHRRHGPRGRRGLHHSGRPQEGHDHHRRGERLPDRGRAGALPPPGRP